MDNIPSTRSQRSADPLTLSALERGSTATSAQASPVAPGVAQGERRVGFSPAHSGKQASVRYAATGSSRPPSSNASPAASQGSRRPRQLSASDLDEPSPSAAGSSRLASARSGGPSPMSQETAAQRLIDMLRAKDETIAAFRDEATAFAEELDLLRADKAAAVGQLNLANRRNEQLAAQVSALQVDLRSTKENSTSASAQSRQASMELQSLEQALKHAERARDGERETVAKLRAELVSAVEQRNDWESQARRCDDELDNVSAELRRVKNELDAAQVDDSELQVTLREQMALLRQQTETAKARLDSMIAREAECQQRAETAERDASDVRAELGEISEQRQQLASQVGMLRSQLQGRTDEVATLEDRESALARQVSQLTAELGELQGLSSSYQEELYELRREHAATKATLTAEREQNDRLRMSLDDAEERLGNVQRRTDSADRGASEMQRSVDRLTRELDSAAAKARADATTVRDLRSEVEAAEQRADELDERLGDAQEELAENDDKVRMLDKRLRQVTAEREALRGRLDAMDEEMSDARREWDQLLEQREESLTRDHERTRHRIRALEDELADVSATAAVYEEKIAAVNAELAITENRCRGESSTSAAMRSELERLRAVSERLSATEEELKSAEVRAARAAEEAETHKRSLRTLEKQHRDFVDDSKKHREAHAARIDELVGEARELRGRLERKESEAQRSAASDRALSSAISDLKRANERLSTLETDLAEARKTVDVERASVSSLRKIVSERSREVTKLRSANDELASSVDATETALAAARREVGERALALTRLVDGVAADTMKVLDTVSAEASQQVEPARAEIDAFMTDLVTLLGSATADVANAAVGAAEAAASNDSGRESVNRAVAAAHCRDAEAATRLLRSAEETDADLLRRVSMAALGVDLVSQMSEKHTGVHKNTAAPSESGPSVSQRVAEARRDGEVALLARITDVVQRHLPVVARHVAARALHELNTSHGGRPAVDWAFENAKDSAAAENRARLVRSHLADSEQRGLLMTRVARALSRVAAGFESDALADVAASVNATKATSRGDAASTVSAPSASTLHLSDLGPLFASSMADGSVPQPPRDIGASSIARPTASSSAKRSSRSATPPPRRGGMETPRQYHQPNLYGASAPPGGVPLNDGGAVVHHGVAGTILEHVRALVIHAVRPPPATQ